MPNSGKRSDARVQERRREAILRMRQLAKGNYLRGLSIRDLIAAGRK